MIVPVLKIHFFKHDIFTAKLKRKRKTYTKWLTEVENINFKKAGCFKRVNLSSPD